MKQFSGYLKQNIGDTSVLLAGGGTKALSEFKIGDYLPLTGGTLTGSLTGTRIWLNYNSNLSSSYSWTNAALTVPSIEIQNYTGNADTLPTLAFHWYGHGGPQITVDKTSQMWITSGAPNSAGTLPTATTYFKNLQLKCSDAKGIYVNGTAVSLEGHKHPYTDITGSSTTADMALVSTTTADTLIFKQLGSRAFDSTSYLPLTGGWIDWNSQICFKGKNGSTSIWGKIGYATSASGQTMHCDNSYQTDGALYITSNGSTTANDVGGIAIDNEGVTVFGAGDTGSNFTGVFRVLNEDKVSDGPQFLVTKSSGATTKYSHTAQRFISNIEDGTQPYACTSKTLNVNLNADLLDGKEATDFSNSLDFYDSGTTSADNITVSHALLSKNVPSSGYWHITTRFHAGLTTKYCFQTAGSYNLTNPALYIRQCYNNTFTAWKQVITSDGGTLDGTLTIKANTTYPLTIWGSSTFDVIHLCDSAGTQKSDIGWLNDSRGNMAYISNIASTSIISTDNSGIYWSDATSNFKKYTVYHSNNSNLSTVDWTCKGLTANNTVAIRTTSTTTYNMLNAYASSLASGEMTTILFGKANSKGNAAQLLYQHNNTNDAYNKLLLGFYDNYQILTITNGGNIGINQTAPTEKLHIVGNELITNGTLFLTRTNDTDNRSKRIFYETTRNYGIKYDYAGNEALIISSGIYASSAVKIYSSNGLIVNDSDGQYTTGTPTIDCKKNCVAINYNWAATTPGYNLYVNGSSYVTGGASFASSIVIRGFTYMSREASLNSQETYNVADNRIYSRLGNNSDFMWLRFYSTQAVSSNYNGITTYFPGGSVGYTQGATDTQGYVDLYLGNTTKRSSGQGLAGRLLLYSTQNAGNSSTVRYCYFVPTVLTANRSYTLPDASGTMALTSDLGNYLPLSGGTLTGGINLNRNFATNGTGIEFYSSSYNSWQIYMHAAGSSQTAGWNKKITTVPSGTYVTSWALRQVIEGNSGFGWTWESMTNTGVSPSIVMELSSNTGNLKTIGSIYAVNYYTTSDRSKKSNITQISEHISKFTLKETNKDAYGVIAQDVPEIFREGEEGNMTVNYNSILSYYIALLENRCSKLENELKELKEKYG